MTTTNGNGAHGASTSVSATPATSLGFGANKFLRHQLKTGRLHTKGSGVAASEPEVPEGSSSESLSTADVPAGADGALAPRTAAPGPATAPRAVRFVRPVQTESGGPAGAGAAHPAAVPAAAPAAPAPVVAAAATRVAGFSRAPEHAGAPAQAAPAAGGFAGAVASQRVADATKVHISTVKLLTRLLGAVAARPGIMAEEHVRSETLRDLHRQSLELGTSLAQRCVLNGPIPDWLRAQATDAAANTLCMAWEGGMSADKIRGFNESLALQLGAIAQDAEAIAGRVGFDGYAVADTVETAQARLYVSITAAIGRLSVLGVPPARGAQCIGEVVDHLQATKNHAGLKLDLRTAWLQGSLGRCTDLIVAVLQSQALVPGGEDRLTFAQRQALSLFQEVENYAQQFIHRKPSGPIEGSSESAEPDPGSMPRAR